MTKIAYTVFALDNARALTFDTKLVFRSWELYFFISTDLDGQEHMGGANSPRGNQEEEDNNNNARVDAEDGGMEGMTDQED